MLIFIAVLFSLVSLVAIFFRLSPIYNLSVCCLLWMAFVNIQFKEISLLKSIGNISYEIYIVQGATIALLVRYRHIEQFQPIAGMCITLILTFIVAYILQSVSKYFMQKCNLI